MLYVRWHILMWPSHVRSSRNASPTTNPLPHINTYTPWYQPQVPWNIVLWKFQIQSVVYIFKRLFAWLQNVLYNETLLSHVTDVFFLPTKVSFHKLHSILSYFFGKEPIICLSIIKKQITFTNFLQFFSLSFENRSSTILYTNFIQFLVLLYKETELFSRIWFDTTIMCYVHSTIGLLNG